VVQRGAGERYRTLGRQYLVDGVELPMKTRLEAIDAQHTDTVALLSGPRAV
jgi:hypothetical protein